MEPASLCVMCGEHWVSKEAFCPDCIEKIRSRFLNLIDFDDTQLNMIFSVVIWDGEFSIDNSSVKHWVQSRHCEEHYIRSICNRFIKIVEDNFRPDEIDYIMK
jgi:hypothetical protein